MKKIKLIFYVGIVLSLITGGVCRASENEKNAVLSRQEFLVNNEKQTLSSYIIENNNYIKLRDIASIVDFGIEYNEKTNSIKIIPEGNYTDDENKFSNEEPLSSKTISSEQKFMLNQQVLDLTAYTVNDSNYVNLKDISAIVGFDVSYNEKDNSVIIDTKKDYKAGYKMVWSDEFDGNKLNEDIWSCEVANTRNEQLQYFASENVSVENSNLVIEARKEKKGGYEYTSGGVYSLEKYSFYKGILEVRAKLPEGKGLWTGIWTMGESDVYNDQLWKWPRGGEIDIMENVGGTENYKKTVYHTVHSAIPGAKKYKHVSNGNSSVLPGDQTFGSDYHLFSLKWTDDYLVWYIDDVEVYKTPTNGQSMFFANNFEQYIRFSFAVGGSWPGDPDETTVFPAKYLIDYVRVYQQSDDSWRTQKRVPIAKEILVDGKPISSFEPYASWSYAVEWTPESKIEAVTDDDCDISYELNGNTVTVNLVDKTDARFFTTYHIDCYPFNRALEIQGNSNINVTAEPIKSTADDATEVTLNIENLTKNPQAAHINIKSDENFLFEKTDFDVNLEASSTCKINVPIKILKNTRYHLYTYSYTVTDKNRSLLDSNSGALSFTAMIKASKEINTEDFNGDISEWENAYPIYINTPNNPADANEWNMADCSVRALTKWDDNNIYILADVFDENSAQNNTGKRIYNGDCIQIAIDPNKDGSNENGGFRDDDFLIGFSNTSEGTERYAWKSASDLEMGVTDSAKIIRDDTNHLTRYLIKLKKSELNGWDFKENSVFGLNMSVDDCDINQDVRENCFQFTKGIEDGANPDEYAEFILIQDKSEKLDDGIAELIFPTKII